jgi:hypothetical protein
MKKLKLKFRRRTLQGLIILNEFILLLMTDYLIHYMFHCTTSAWSQT